MGLRAAVRRAASRYIKPRGGDPRAALRARAHAGAGMRDMRGRVTLVSGGARGIGRASALALARAGSAVAVGDVREGQAAEGAAEVKAAGGTALAVAMDVTDADAVAAAAARTREALGPVEVLVHCAGSDGVKPL